MFEILASLGRDLQASQTLNGCLDRVFRDVCALGFQSLVYDYAPVPLSMEGALITPTVFMQRNAPGDMQHVWCEHGYYQHDPFSSVQRNLPPVRMVVPHRRRLRWGGICGWTAPASHALLMR